jgi:hypothetical protein
MWKGRTRRAGAAYRSHTSSANRSGVVTLRAACTPWSRPAFPSPIASGCAKGPAMPMGRGLRRFEAAGLATTLGGRTSASRSDVPSRGRASFAADDALTRTASPRRPRPHPPAGGRGAGTAAIRGGSPRFSLKSRSPIALP